MVTLAESKHPIFRATSPLSRGQLKSKGGGKLSIHYCADQDTITTVFRTITSVNQLSHCGAVAEMCEEYESFNDRTGKPVVGGQSSSSFVPSVIKINVPLNKDDHAHKDLLLQRVRKTNWKVITARQIEQILYGCRIPACCWNRTVFHGKRYCRIFTIHRCSASLEYTLPRDEETSEPKSWIRGNTQIGPVLEVTTCCLQGKYGAEIKIMSISKDNSHSWVSISHGLSKLVTNLNNNEQETSEMQFEEYALRLNAGDFASRSQAKAKPQRRDYASSSTRTIPIGERTWADVEPGEYSISDYEVSKKLIHLLRHRSLPRENDGAIEFWRIKDNLQKHFLYCHHWSDEKWKKSMARGGGNKKRHHCCTDSSRAILYLRALQGDSGRSLIDPTLQDNVIIPSGFFQYIYHVGCAINLHSIINSGLIRWGQKIEQQPDSILSANGFHGQKPKGSWRDRHLWPASCKLHASSMKETPEYGLCRHQPCSEERIEVLSGSIECYHPSRNTPSLLYPESCSDGNWRSHIRESICVTSSSKDFLETWQDERIGFRSCSTTRTRSRSTIPKS